MYINQPIKFSLLAAGFIACSLFSQAQDTTKKKTIDITSTFKPVLREAVKLTFNAAPPAIDTSKPRLNYTIPQQNLLLGYQPMGLNPVALQIDSLSSWQSSNYIKVGVGNVHIPFIQAGFSFGDGKNSFFNIFAHQYNSKGKLPFQKNNSTGVTAAGTMKTAANLEWNGNLGFKADDYFFYGYRPTTLAFSKEDLRQRWQVFSGRLSLRNMSPTEFGLTYNPNIKVSVVGNQNDGRKATEANTVVNLPLTKTVGKVFGVNLGLTADLTNYRPTGKSTIQNNLFYVSPSVQFKTPNFYITAGAIPSWDNGNFKLLPNIMADVTTNNQAFTIQAGWIGYYNKGSYERFASINPWIAQPEQLLNTRVEEKYAGFKGSVLNHITYSAKVGFVQYRNMPLFVNDSIDGKTFYTEYSSSIDALQMHGEVAYVKGEDFNLSAGVTINNFSKIRDHQRAWGLLPFELNSSLRWQILKDFYLKSDLYFWDGAAYRRDGDGFKGETGFDFSAGLEFKITRQFNLWLQMNNIFNNKYERWNQYEVYGFNILGGVVFNFNQKK
ncbi:MAG: hypothetical protein H7Y27_05380 [Gemmatimonadaceae bacterium]|nr:hypothetical protein [Chitinophagaceae bacterium]